MKLPLFPLQSVFYPGETVPLHIFEDRYKQLINDCRKEALTFGIPVYSVLNETTCYILIKYLDYLCLKRTKPSFA